LLTLEQGEQPFFELFAWFARSLYVQDKGKGASHSLFPPSRGTQYNTGLMPAKSRLVCGRGAAGRCAMAAPSRHPASQFRSFLTSHTTSLCALFPSRRRRRWLVLLLTLLTLLVGPNGLLTSLSVVQAQRSQAALADAGHPNRFDPTQDAHSSKRHPQHGSSDPNWKTPPPQHLLRTLPTPMQPGSLSLSPGKAAQFLGSDGRLEVDVPAAAVTAADVSQAGGGLTLLITQIAPASGSSAGGSGLISFGTYLLQLVNPQGKRVLHGLHLPITLKWHYGSQESAFDLAHAFVVLNVPLPRGVQLAPAASANTPALGVFSTQHATLDTASHTLTVSPLVGTPSTDVSWNTTSPIATFGKPDPFNVDLSAGSLTMGFPIDLPPGPGGFTPPVTLSYSSAGVSEQHNVQGAAPWAGEGWNVSMGSISWAEQNVTAGCSGCSANWEDRWQLNDPFGTAAELIPPNINVSTYYDDTGNPITPSPVTWQASPATHAKIISFVGPNSISGMANNPPCFRVFLPNGIMEEFGCTPDSLQYYIEPSGANQGKAYLSNWLLDLITDRNGNQIHLTYQWDTVTGAGGHTYPRDVALATVEYDSPTCHDAQTACTGSAWAPELRVNFVVAHTPTRLTNTPSGCNTGTNLRCDDPLDLSGSGGLAAPQVQSTFVLNDIQVQVRTSGTGSWNTLRDYQFSYEQSGPSTITDSATGKQESVAGMLDLTELQVFGDDGTTSLPTRAFSYTTLTQHYEDDAYNPNPSAGCGPSWNSSACLLWSQSYAGNSRYLATADNGLGLHQVFSWAEGRNNTHGVNGGGSNTADPLYCDGKEGQGYPCNQADDQNWSHAILTQQTSSVLRVAQNGQGGQQTSVSVDSTTTFTYQLTYPLLAQPCSDCVAGMYWGNQNDADYLDYYNNHFMGFAQAAVTHPDGSLEVHHYYATEGWGLYDTSQVSCFSINPCHNDPWWDLTNVAHGHETRVDTYDTDGTTLLKTTLSQYQALCPPSGVSGTPAWTQWGNWKGNLVSELDHNNPVASCDLQTTQVDTYTFQGSTGSALTSYTASPGFSATQGQDQWRYQYSTNGEASFSDMTYNSSGNFWSGPEINCLIWSNGQHPGGSTCDAVRTWVAPSAGTVTITANGTLTLATGCSQMSPGVQIRVLKNGTQIWPASGWQMLSHGDSFTFPPLSISVASGDQLHFVLAHLSNNLCDSTTWDPTITLVGGNALHTTTFSAYDSYGRVVSTTTTSDDGGSPGSPLSSTTRTVYVWNDAVTATSMGASGTYLIAFPAYTYTVDGSGNRVSCSYTSYDGLNGRVGPQNDFTGAGHATATDSYATLTPTTCGYQASQGFSTTQGQNQWRYQSSTDGEATFQDMTYNSALGQWGSAADSYCLVFPAQQHPGSATCDAVRTWVAPSAGTVMLTANGAISLATGCGSMSAGVRIRVLKNGTQIWPSSGWQMLSHGGTVAFPPLRINVAAGDQLHFVLAQLGGSNQCDTTNWDPQVDFGTPGGNLLPALSHTTALGTSFLASQGFSAVQGQNQWRYQYSTDGEATFADMTYDSANSRWHGPDSSCIVGSNWQHPGSSSCDSARTWVAPSAGMVMLTANGLLSLVAACGNPSGVQIRVLKNGIPIWPTVGWQMISHGGTFAFPTLTLAVTSGDTLRFVAQHLGGSNACDTTFWDPRITYLEGWMETTATYDVYGNPLTTTDADANAGNTAHVGCTVGGTTTYSTCTTYDTTFAVLPTTQKNAFNQTSSTGYTQTAAGGFGLWATSATDVNGQSMSTSYDPLGRIISQTLPGETSGQPTTSWSYQDFCGATGAQSPCVEVTTTQQLNDTQAVTSFAFYDGFGRLVETRSPGPDNQDVVQYRYYDPSGRVVFESISYFVPAFAGNPQTTLAFSIPDSTQPGTSKSYDGMGRILTQTDALSYTTRASYGVVCGIISGDTACYEQGLIVDPLGHQHGLLADAQGREIYDQLYSGNSTATYAVYATTTYAYNSNGSLTQITHPDGITHTGFQYDAINHQIGMTDPDRGTESYVHDANGNLVQSTDARGTGGTFYVGYDGLNRQLWRSVNSTGSNPYVTYTYDSTTGGNYGVGEQTGESFSNGTLSGSYSYVYDQRGRLISTTLTVDGTSYPIQATYDDSDNVLTQTYPTGEVVTTDYTPQGWMSGLATQQGSSTTTLLSAASYTGTAGAAQLMTGAQLGGNIYQYAATYDLLLQLTDLKYTRVSDGATLFEEARTLDGVGNVKNLITTLPQGTDQQQFCYDEQNRLTWAGAVGTPSCTGTAITPGTLTSAQYTQTFTYDTLNRLTSGPLGTYSYSTNAHVHAVTSIGSAYTASYDAAGNMTCRAPNGSVTCSGTPTGAQLTYNAEGRLIHWQNAPGSPTTQDDFLYDGEGQRVEQKVTQGSTITTTLYVGNVEEISTTGATTTTTTYYYSDSGQIAEAVNGVFSYLAGDGLGSVTVALNASGTATSSQLYTPFGGVRYSNGAMPTSYGFIGQRADNTTGLDYYNARYYDPTAGSFSSADTLLPGGGYDFAQLDRYAYVGNNPETHTDPSGHCFIVCLDDVGKAITKAWDTVVTAASTIALPLARGIGIGIDIAGAVGAVLDVVGPLIVGIGLSLIIDRITDSHTSCGCTTPAVPPTTTSGATQVDTGTSGCTSCGGTGGGGGGGIGALGGTWAGPTLGTGIGVGTLAGPTILTGVGLLVNALFAKMNPSHSQDKKTIAGVAKQLGMDNEERREFGDALEAWKDANGIGHGKQLGWNKVLELAKDWLKHGTITIDPEELGIEP
jgi:RHS repeat-associated protein